MTAARQSLRPGLALLAAAFGAACAAGEARAPGPGAPAPRLVPIGEHVLTEIDGRAALLTGDRPSLIFDGQGGVAGFTGCNRLNTRLLDPSATGPLFAPVATTKRGCPGEVATLERAVLAALADAAAYSSSGGQLVLRARDGRVLACWRSISARADGDAAGIHGRDWVLRTLDGAAIAAEGAPTLRFDGESVSGDTGCNRWNGQHVRTAGRSRFILGAMTQRACLAPARMSLERRFLDALAQATDVRLEEGALILRNADGGVPMVFQVEPR